MTKNKTFLHDMFQRTVPIKIWYYQHNKNGVCFRCAALETTYVVFFKNKKHADYCTTCYFDYFTSKHKE